MIRSEEVSEVVRLDDLETKGWKHYLHGLATGSKHTMARAERLIGTAHRNSLANVSANQDQPWVWSR